MLYFIANPELLYSFCVYIYIYIYIYIIYIYIQYIYIYNIYTCNLPLPTLKLGFHMHGCIMRVQPQMATVGKSRNDSICAAVDAVSDAEKDAAN